MSYLGELTALLKAYTVLVKLISEMETDIPFTELILLMISVVVVLGLMVMERLARRGICQPII